jgi:hypothetical protein
MLDGGRSNDTAGGYAPSDEFDSAPEFGKTSSSSRQEAFVSTADELDDEIPF